MGFDVNIFVDMSERETKNLKCGVCFNVLDNAINSLCGHTFCKFCVQTMVQNKHKLCPECRTPFARGKSVTNCEYLICVGDCVFTRNIKINAFISELKTKCKYDFNGCKQTIELGLLSAHHKTCDHRFCKTCGLIAGRADEHNCVELLKKWKTLCEQNTEKSNKYMKEMSLGLKELAKERDEWKEKYDSSLNVIIQTKDLVLHSLRQLTDQCQQLLQESNLN